MKRAAWARPNSPTRSLACWMATGEKSTPIREVSRDRASHSPGPPRPHPRSTSVWPGERARAWARWPSKAAETKENGSTASQTRRTPGDATMAANPSSKPAAVGGEAAWQSLGMSWRSCDTSVPPDFVRVDQSVADEPRHHPRPASRQPTRQSAAGVLGGGTSAPTCELARLVVADTYSMGTCVRLPCRSSLPDRRAPRS
jgi:hypothetical protein